MITNAARSASTSIHRRRVSIKVEITCYVMETYNIRSYYRSQSSSIVIEVVLENTQKPKSLTIRLV